MASVDNKGGRQLAIGSWLSPAHPERVCEIIATAVSENPGVWSEKRHPVLEGVKYFDGETLTTVTMSPGRIDVGIVCDDPRRVDPSNVDDAVDFVRRRLPGHIFKDRPVVTHVSKREGSADYDSQRLYAVGYATRQNREMLPMHQVLARALGETIYHYGEFNRAVAVDVVMSRSDGVPRVEKVYVWINRLSAKDRALVDRLIAQWADLWLVGQRLDDIMVAVNVAGAELTEMSRTRSRVFRSDTMRGAHLAQYGYAVGANRNDPTREMSRALYGYGFNAPQRVSAMVARYLAVDYLNHFTSSPQAEVALYYHIYERRVRVFVGDTPGAWSAEPLELEVNLSERDIFNIVSGGSMVEAAIHGCFGHNFSWERPLKDSNTKIQV